MSSEAFVLERDWPWAAGTLYARLRGESGAAWRAYVEHPFVAALGAGTLGRDEFAAWLAQDYLYLVQYARAYALLVYKSGSVADMAAASGVLHGLLAGEMALHRRELARFGIDDAAIAELPQTLELVAYSRWMLDRGVAGDVLDLAVTLAACLGGYAEIGLRLARDAATREENHPYRDWIGTYAGDAYGALVRSGLGSLETLGARFGGAARFPALLAQFREAVRLEAAFWGAGRAALMDTPRPPDMLTRPRGAPTRG